MLPEYYIDFFASYSDDCHGDRAVIPAHSSGSYSLCLCAEVNLMNCSHCSMMVAVKKIQGDDLLLISARHHLLKAVDYAGRYQKAQDSIYWMTSTTVVKRGVRSTLDALAYDTYSACMEAARCLNMYGNAHRDCALPLWWNDAIINLHLAQHALGREHQREIAAKQLSLFDVC